MGWTQEEITFVVLSVFYETEEWYSWAIARLTELAQDNDIARRIRLLENWLARKRGYRLAQFRQNFAGITTRLCRWPYYLGLIACEASRNLRGFFDLLGSNTRVRRVTGITHEGLQLCQRYDGTQYEPRMPKLGGLFADVN